MRDYGGLTNTPLLKKKSSDPLIRPKDVALLRCAKFLLSRSWRNFTDATSRVVRTYIYTFFKNYICSLHDETLALEEISVEKST